jgi:50S ribosomal subunit-associated GTPase HflX
VTAHQPDPAPGAEPERGFTLAVLAQGAAAEEELAELEELARTAGVERAPTSAKASSPS